MSRLGGVGGLLGAFACVIGIWFFVKEHDFAQRFDNELAAQLQWVGVGIALLGAAAFLIGLAVGFRDD